MHKNSVSKQKPFFFDKTSSTKYIWAILILVVLLVVYIGLLVFSNISSENLKKEYSAFVAGYDSKVSSLNSIIFSLNKENSDLNSALNKLNGEYNSLSSKNNALEYSYSNLKDEVDSTISKINDYQIEIQSSLDWFSSNSVLGNHENILLNLKSSCKKETSKVCQINLGCFHLVNSEFINYKYKDDLITSNVSDKLQTISEFIKNKGGDCEDFSLFFKAEYNSLIESCNGKKPTLFAWVEKKGSRFWSNFDNTWYLENATQKYLDKNNVFPVIVCGSIFDPNTGQVNGHCVLAFANKKIVSSEDISVLNSAELIEPQTGGYLGFVGNDSGIFLVSNDSVHSSFINTLITDNDFFIFSNNEWSNYALFGEELDNDKNSLENLIKK